MMHNQQAIAQRAHKAYERVLETAEDAGLFPLTGEHDRSLRLSILDYFEACDAKKKNAARWNTIAALIFAALFIGQLHIQYQLFQRGL